MLKVEIQCINHKEGAKIYGSYFGLREEDFLEGNFLAVENVTLITHSGTHLNTLGIIGLPQKGNHRG